MRGAVLGISSLLAYLMLLVSKAELFLGHAQFVHFRLFAYSPLPPPPPWLCCHEKLGMQKPRSFSYCVYLSTFYFLVDYYFYYVHNVERSESLWCQINSRPKVWLNILSSFLLPHLSKTVQTFHFSPLLLLTLLGRIHISSFSLFYSSKELLTTKISPSNDWMFHWKVAVRISNEKCGWTMDDMNQLLPISQVSLLTSQNNFSKNLWRSNAASTLIAQSK